MLKERELIHFLSPPFIALYHPSQSFPTAIVGLDIQGTRIAVSDQQESVFFVSYKPQVNKLIPFADDVLPRWMTSILFLDYETVVGSDKFGNVFTLRFDPNLSKSIDSDPTGNSITNEKSQLNGLPYKLTLLSTYHFGDIITSLNKSALVPGGREVIIMTGLNGSVSTLIPFVSKEDVELMSTLEMHLRQEPGMSLVGRDHLAYRGSYLPVKNVIDGELLETFGLLPPHRQNAIAEELDRNKAEVAKKLESFRTGAAF